MSDCLIIDFGSSTIKAGTSKRAEPDLIFDSVIGTEKYVPVISMG